MVDLQKAIAHAQQFGAEAAANQRRYMISDDRSELAAAYGVERWLDIPVKHQEILMDAFEAGFKREKSYQL